MTSKIRSLLLLTMSSGLALISVISARASENGFFYYGDIGAALTTDTKVKESPEPTPPYFANLVKFDPGIRLSFGSGYRFKDWLSAGGEIGLIANTISGVDANYPGATADGNFFQVPLMANTEFRLPNKTRFMPFVGGGPGAAFSVLKLNEGALGKGSGSEVVFAWQGYGGVRYKLSDKMSLGLVYKYFGAGSTSTRVHFGESSAVIHLGNTISHSFGASFSMDF